MKQDLKFFINNLWRWKCGLPELNGNEMEPKEIIKRKWHEEFIQFMKNRLIMGALRYEEPSCFKEQKSWDRLGAIQKHLDAMRKDGNKEHLVDIANYCMLEFEHGDGHFVATDDADHHADKKEPVIEPKIREQILRTKVDDCEHHWVRASKKHKGVMLCAKCGTTLV